MKNKLYHNLKRFLKMVKSPVSESRLPKHVVENPVDMNEISDEKCSELIEKNYDVWSKLTPTDQAAIAKWWEMEWDQTWEEIAAWDHRDTGEYDGDVITDSELVQYLTEEGYLLK